MRFGRIDDWPVVIGDDGIRNFALEKNSSVRGGMSDVSISSSVITLILDQSVLEVLLISLQIRMTSLEIEDESESG
jgi:hypothetical protein